MNPKTEQPLIYHICDTAQWAEAQTSGTYAPAKFPIDGFIHCSIWSQVAGVAKRLFQNRQDLCILIIQPRHLEVPVVFENLEGGEELFPHIYGHLPTQAVLGELHLNRSSDGSFHFSEQEPILH